MNESRIVLDPTAELTTSTRELLPRLESIKGKTVGLLDISKARGDVLLNRLEAKLTEYGTKVERFAKPTFTRVAPVDLRQEISTKCDVVIEALAD